MKPYITIYIIDNGYLAQERDSAGGVFRSVYLKNFSMETLIALDPNGHEAVLRNKVMSMDAVGNKIPAIKMVRDYCINNNYDKYRGLKDAKDYVESVRTDWCHQLLTPRYFSTDHDRRGF